MRKTPLLSIILTGIIGTSLASCSQDEPEVNLHQGMAIDFRPAMASRAAETTNANLTDIYVTAIETGSTDNYFSNLQFTKGNDGFFSSETKYYWPGDNNTLTFYAYAPSQDDMGADVIIDNTTKQITNFITPTEISQQIDIITTTATGDRKDNEASGVPLTFKHILSQIEIDAKSESKAYKYVVAGARIGRAATTGTYDFTTGQWTLDMWHETEVYATSCDSVTLSATPVSIMGASGNAMLIPQQLTPWMPVGDPDNAARAAYLSVLIRVTTVDGALVYPSPTETKSREYGWVALPIDTKWEAGKKYVYVLDFTHGAGYHDPDDPNPGQSVLGDPIKITVDVSDWTSSSSDIDMPHGGGRIY